MNTLDIIIALCFIPGIIQGITKGLVQQIMAILSLVIGIKVAFLLASKGAESLGLYSNADPKLLQAICFIAIAVVTILVIVLVSKILTKVIKLVMLGWLNRLLGVLFSMVTTTIVLGVLITVFESLNASFGMVKPEILSESVLYGLVKDSCDFLFPYLKTMISNA